MAHLWAVVSVLILTYHQILAQSITDFPQCAVCGIYHTHCLFQMAKNTTQVKAAFPKISSNGCKITDFSDIECICKDQSLIDSLLPKVKTECCSDDFESMSQPEL